jgi:hypothetical protein
LVSLRFWMVLVYVLGWIWGKLLNDFEVSSGV